MTNLELSIKQEKDFQKRMIEKSDMWHFIQILPDLQIASKLIDDSDQIKALYNRNIEPFNIAEDKDGKDSNN